MVNFTRENHSAGNSKLALFLPFPVTSKSNGEFIVENCLGPNTTSCATFAFSKPSKSSTSFPVFFLATISTRSVPLRTPLELSIQNMPLSITVPLAGPGVSPIGMNRISPESGTCPPTVIAPETLCFPSPALQPTISTSTTGVNTAIGPERQLRHS